MADSTKDKITAFFFGDAFATVYLLGAGGSFIHELQAFGVKLIVTLILGAVGGIGGIIGKDIYNKYKNKTNGTGNA